MSSKSLLKKCTQAAHQQNNKLRKNVSSLQLRNFQKPNNSVKASASYAFSKVAPLLQPSKSQRKQYSATLVKSSNNSNKQALPLRSTIVILCVGMGVAAWYLWEDEIAVAEGGRKPRIVILGSGWGALSCLKEIDANEYEVVVVSPRNYFLFTPLLPSATVGTLQPKSIIEPIRKYCKRNNIHSQYFEAKCVDIIPERNVIVCQDVDQLNKGNVETFEVPYDHLVVSVGAVNNTFGTPGVYENCYFLKEIEDAQKIRKRIIDCFETANLPGQSEDIKKKLLSFVVVGGGPNGVEFAAEFHDFLHEDLSNWYPHLYPYVKITLIELMDHILNTFDKRISDFAEKKFRRDLIDLKVNSMVSAVTKDAVVIKPMEKGKPSEKAEEIPYGLCVWSTGINTNPLTTKIIQKLPQTQNNRRALVTDRFLTVQGTNNVYAIGDCATINQERMLNKFLELFREHDKDKNGFLSSQEFEELVNKEGHKYPQLEEYANRANILFHEADLDKDNQINEGEFKEILSKLDSRLKLLPATAQVASQQGRYLGKLFNKKAYKDKLEPFRYRHLGSFAYIGTERAVAEFPNRFVLNGYGAWWLWRSVYLSKQFSLKNKLAVAGDWMKKTISGREITRL